MGLRRKLLNPFYYRKKGNTSLVLSCGPPLIRAKCKGIRHRAGQQHQDDTSI